MKTENLQQLKSLAAEVFDGIEKCYFLSDGVTSNIDVAQILIIVHRNLMEVITKENDNA